MTLSQAQLDQFKEHYAYRILDGMDIKTLEQLAYDTIIESMANWDEDDVMDEIKLCYDDETATEMFEEVTN